MEVTRSIEALKDLLDGTVCAIGASSRRETRSRSLSPAGGRRNNCSQLFSTHETILTGCLATPMVKDKTR